MKKPETWTDEVYYEYLSLDLLPENREFFLEAWNEDDWSTINMFCHDFTSLAKRKADPEGEKFHFLQQIVIDDHGVARFRENKIVRFLLDNGNHDLNDLAVMNFTNADRMQFAQLIGYSVSGFGDLNYAASQVVNHADRVVERLFK